LAAAFVVDYENLESPAELRSTADGQVLAEFSEADIKWITFSTDQEFFVVHYADESAEVYQAEEGSPRLVESFSDPVSSVVFDTDSIQGGGQPLTQSQVQGRVTDLEGDMWTFEGQAGDIVTINMVADFDTLLEIFDPNGSRLMASDQFFGEYNRAQIDDFKLPSSGTYAIVARGYGGSIGSYSLSVEGINTFVSDESDVSEAQAATAFVVYYAAGRAEVWDIAEEKVLAAFSNVSSVSFSPDPDRGVFVADLSGLLEVYRFSDGVRLARKVSEIIYSRDKEATYFIVTYDDSPGKIYHTATGDLVATLKDEVEDITLSFDENGTYFVVKYPGDHNEVWVLQDAAPHMMTDLGSNVINYFFDVPNQRLVVHYEDNQVYLIDLAMLEALREELSAEDQLREICDYLFQPRKFDEGELREYLGENEPVACPEDTN